MLYKLDLKNNSIKPLGYNDLSNHNKKEKDLENLIASSLFEVLFEENNLMVIFQERQWQAEADIYALNENGDLIIFELKRSTADEGALAQIFRYTQEASQWRYSTLENKLSKYLGKNENLSIRHKEAFNLEHPLEKTKFNTKQHMFIIGSASNEKLRNGVDYWKKQNISIQFLPYRIFEIAGEEYFEFFTLPYDVHSNLNCVKGVLFDTNGDSIWYMMEKKCIAAFGDAKKFITYLRKGDYVFFSHKNKGIIAVGKVKNDKFKKDDKDNTYYHELDFLTELPSKNIEIKAMPFSKATEVLNKNFFWARTIKVPYLNKEESDILVEEVKKYLVY